MTTAKEDEVTSSEEAATVDVRVESKGTEQLCGGNSVFSVSPIDLYVFLSI